jgi:RNA polymerase sigma factor (sigma-70 family)
MSQPGDTPPLQGDEEQFFRQHSDKLRRSVGRSVNTSEANIDDACAFAWMQFFRHQPSRDTAYKWLWKVAWREAIRYDRRSRAMDDPGEVIQRLNDPRDAIADREAMIDARARLSVLDDRERFGVLMHAAGYTYEEAAERLGISPSRLNQVLVRARAHLRETEDEMRLQLPGSHPRAKLLAELLRQPPAFLHAALGRPPTKGRDRAWAERRREWGRIALSIVDYRIEHGITDPMRPFGRSGPDRSDPACAELQRRVDGFDATQPWQRHTRGIEP